MLGFLVENISKEDYIKILKSIVYLIYRKTVLTKEIVSFIQQIASFVDLDEDELQNIFQIDTRYELDFEELVSSMELKSSKVLLIVLILFSEIFEDIDLSKYYKKIKIYDYIPLDNKTINDIQKYTKEYLKITENIYDEIYKDKSFIQKFLTKDEKLIKKYFLIDIDHIKKLSVEDNINFLNILKLFMLEDGFIDDVEKDVLFIWENILEVESSLIDKKDLDISLSNLPTIKSDWLKRFLIFSFLVSQSNQEQKLSFINKVAKVFNISKDTLKDIVKLSKQYQQNIKTLIKFINSDTILSPSEDFAKSIKITFNITEAALLFMPGGFVVNSLKMLIKTKTLARGLININRQSYIDKLGVVDVVSQNSDELIICIDGFLSELEKRQFDDWKRGLLEYGVKSDIKGFQWGAENYKTFVVSMLRAWYEAVYKTKKEALELAFEIEKLSKRYKNISLMGHSLGTRVIYHTISHLKKMEIKLKNIYLFGGAVSSTSTQARVVWTTALTVVKEDIYNFYSYHDEVLKKSYKTTMLGDIPIGLDQIKPYNIKDVQIERLKNIDVSGIVKGHTEYKPKLAQIFKSKNIKLS